MNISEESVPPHTDELHSPFSVNASEIVFAIAVVLVTIFGLWSFLHTALPYSCGLTVDDVLMPCGWTKEEAWQLLGLPLFSKYVVPFVLLNAVAAVFLLRVIRKDRRGFSLLGSLALAWPMFCLLGIHFLGYFSIYCFPIGLIFGVIATFIPLSGQGKKLDWISLPINLLSMVSCFMYLAELLELYGD
jgi:hypothetical protein